MFFRRISQMVDDERRLLRDWLTQLANQYANTDRALEVSTLIDEFEAELRLASDWQEIVDLKADELRIASDVLARAQAIAKRLGSSANNQAGAELLADAEQVVADAYKAAFERSTELQSAKLGLDDAGHRADSATDKVRGLRDKLSGATGAVASFEELVPGSTAQVRFNDAVSEADELLHAINQDLEGLFEMDSEPADESSGKSTSSPLAEETVDEQLRKIMDEP
jgi:transposase-like protein